MALYTIPSTGSGVGAVKSVQRGVASGRADIKLVIPINTVNPAKTLVFLSSSTGSYYGTSYQLYSCYLNGMTSTSISVTGPGYYANSTYTANEFSWQVIEYV